MRKLLMILCLVAAGLLSVAASTTAQAQYYIDGFYGYGGYGPFYDCGNGTRCYIGPPYTYWRHYGRYYRVPGQYYFGAGGGYYHRWF